MKNEKLLKVGIYLRLSNEDKNKTNENIPSESIKNQRNLLIDYIKKNENFILVDEYCDEDLSGAGTYRPEFERMINDCKHKKLDIILCKSQSRFSRDMEIIEKYINNKFIEWGIRFIGISDNSDTENIGNKKARQINGLVNEWFLEDLSENIKYAFKTKMKQGEFISPFAAYGYKISKNNNNKLVIDPDASIIVKNIYNLYLNGMGYTKIAKYLNSKNIPSPSLYKYKKGIKLNIVSNKAREDIKWNANEIKTILTNEIYLGHLIQGKRTTISYKNHKIIYKNKEDWIRCENTHDAIIDIETFNKVKNYIKKRTRPLKKTGIVHIFSGLVFCKECMHNMRKKDSKNHEYLVCTNSQNEYKECNNNHSIRYDKLEEIILNKINKLIESFYDIDILKKEYNKKSKLINNKINCIKNNNIQFNKYKKILKLNKYIVDEFINKIYVGKIINNKREIQIIWNL